MGILNEQAGCRGGKLVKRRCMQFGVLLLLGWFLAFGSTDSGWAVQRLSPVSEQAGGSEATANVQPQQELQSTPGGQSTEALPAAAGSPQGHEAPAEAVAAPQKGAEPAPPSQAAHPAPKAEPQKQAAAAQTHEPAKAGEPVKAGEPAKVEEGAEKGHGPGLAVISPIPGVTFVDTMINLMEHELHERFLGWRPNDLIVGRFTDNINNYQLGVLEAIRFTTIRLKDSLTRMGDADTYDPDLEHALNLSMNSATSFWFPSAESSYGEAIQHLRNFKTKLEKGQRTFYYRKDNLVALLSAYKDLLGNVNRTLITSPVSWFKTDDYFYYAKGVAHVYYEILKVVRVGYQPQLASTMYGIEMMDEVLHELHRAEAVDPWIVLDCSLGSIFANHRANLNAPLSEVSHLLVVLSQL